MTAKHSDIERWFDEGVGRGKRWLIVACDTLDYETYPVFVDKGQDIRKEVKKYDGPNMQRVEEVYDLAGDKQHQLNITRCRADLKDYGDINIVRYIETLLGKVGEHPAQAQPRLVVLRLQAGQEVVQLALSFSDARQMLYDSLRCMREQDPVSKDLYEKFKEVFSRLQ